MAAGSLIVTTQPLALPTMSGPLTLLFAAAGGVAVGNLYWSQPLLEFIASDLHASTTIAGWLVTATLLGYAAGILLIVPLGDVVNRRPLLLTMMLCASVALVLCAVAPTMTLLLMTSTLLGFTTVGGQILIPLSADLADDARRGHVVGTVASGIIIGILVSRSISGLVADLAGWRAIYLAAAVVNSALAVALYRALPPVPPKARMAYPALIASVGALVLRERTVRWTLALASMAFAVFMMFWTSLTFLLSGPPFNFSVSVIGLFGLAGLAGALGARGAGRLHDRGWSMPATGIGWALIVITFLIAAVAGESVVLLVVAIVLLDVAIMAVSILNQTRLFAVSHEARSRLNTAYVTNNFIGGALGSAAGTILWRTGQWTAVSLAGAAISLLALLLWAEGRRGALVVASP